jgi:hypothetical protein
MPMMLMALCCVKLWGWGMCIRECFILYGFKTASAFSILLALILCCIWRLYFNILLMDGWMKLCYKMIKTAMNFYELFSTMVIEIFTRVWAWFRVFVADFLKTFLIGDRFLIHQECKKWHLKVVLTIGYATESHTFLIYFCLVLNFACFEYEFNC